MVPNVNTITAVVKMYLRELPEPLFTSAHYGAFIEAARGPGPAASKLPLYQKALALLPKPNLDTINFLFSHLVRVAAQSAVNLMTPAALATCFGPTLLTPAEVRIACAIADPWLTTHTSFYRTLVRAER